MIAFTATQPDRSSSQTLFTLYGSNAEEVTYCDEDGVFQIGSLTLDTPCNLDSLMNVEVLFGNTEISVKARHLATGNRTEERFDFLSF